MQNMQKTYIPKKDEIKGKWYLVDAEGKVLGRIATKIAGILKGKHRADYTPHLDLKDYVVVINANKIKLTGKKWTDKIYYSHSQYPGGLKEVTAEKLFQKKPTELLRRAVWGMLPHNRLGREIITHLRLFVGSEHRHKAQNPEPIDL